MPCNHCCKTPRKRIAFALEEIAALLQELVQQSRAVRLKLKLKVIDEKGVLVKTIHEEDGEMGVTILTDMQKVDLSVSAVDAKGFPAQVEAASVEWKSSDDTILTVVEDPNDETKAVAVAVKPGTAQIQVSADADLGAGVVTISGVADVEVTSSQATALGVGVGTPTDQ